MNDVLDGGAYDEGTTPHFLTGGGELGALMRGLDWSTSALGAPGDWPQSLRTAVSLMLSSRYPMFLAWGSELSFLYNDAYRPIFGKKHPDALGQPFAEVWSDVWDSVAPLVDQAMNGNATFSEDLVLFMERHGYLEETYFTFSYSPVRDESGGVGGMFCACTETTGRVLGERRLQLLRNLGVAASRAGSARAAATACLDVLDRARSDVPFALLYATSPDQEPELIGKSGRAPNGDLLDPSFWRLEDSFPDTATEHSLGRIASGDEPRSLWDDPVQQAFLLPLLERGQDFANATLVLGISPRRAFDDEYRDFLGLVAERVSTAMADAAALEAERERAAKLAEIDRAKTDFFSNVSHEFRTPLTLMLGPLEETLAHDDRLPGADIERLKVVHRNALRLLKLVNSLLAFSRVEAGRARANFEPLDLAAFTAELASNFRSAAERAGLELIVACPQLPEPVYADPEMWEQIVLNLLSNAVKFTLEGSITVTIGTADDTVEMTVRDTGPGVPEKEVPRLFERFHRVQGVRGRSFEGSGIGLALVHDFVRLHGGTIDVESDEGRGTTFRVRLPLGKQHLPADQVRAPTTAARGTHAEGYVEEALRWLPQAASGETHTAGTHTERAEHPHGARASILIADDNADMREYICRLLSTRHDVHAVTDGQAALEFLRKERPDLVLTDIMMPRLDGFALLQAIREDAQLQDLPVIVLSARAGEEASIEGREAGADDYLTKPFSARELVARTESALAMARMRQKMTGMLRENEARFRNMADNAPVMIWTTDPSGACTYHNRSWYEFTGQTPQTALEFGWLDALHPDDREPSEALFRSVNARREPFEMEYRLRRADGSYRWVIDAAAPWFGVDGEFLGYIGSVIDITERKEVEDAQRRLNDLLETRVAEVIAEREKTEEQLRQAQKMEAVGRLTGGIAHDFNNLLQVVGGNLEMLGRHVRGSEKAERRLRNALAGVSRGAKLASQLLAFGRRQALAPKVVDLGRLVEEIEDLLRRSLGEEIEIETTVAEGLWHTLVDPSQVENALLNLAINARDAMDGRGRLQIRLKNAIIDAQAAADRELVPGEYVVVAIEDSGSGMTPDVLAQVFEPFFTTKPEGQGTGLGLSMVYGFVKQSGGHLEIDSEPGQGTEVRMYLPRSTKTADTAVGARPRPVTGGDETILIAEDDQQVRRTVVDMLEQLGYRTVTADDGQSALALIEAGLEPDLLFTDVIMPGPVRSADLAARARKLSPRMAIVFTSGYTQEQIVENGRLVDGVDLLRKPYTRETLARKIRQALDTAATSSPAGAGDVPGKAERPQSAAEPDSPADDTHSTESIPPST